MNDEGSHISSRFATGIALIRMSVSLYVKVLNQALDGRIVWQPQKDFPHFASELRIFLRDTEFLREKTLPTFAG